uniref:Uncharacterized protein n=1 Tax=Cacopsylla melanoneura TaxID=428564 RepID=A0A8D8RZ83_9HEMI
MWYHSAGKVHQEELFIVFSVQEDLSECRASPSGGIIQGDSEKHVHTLTTYSMEDFGGVCSLKEVAIRLPVGVPPNPFKTSELQTANCKLEVITVYVRLRKGLF